MNLALPNDEHGTSYPTQLTFSPLISLSISDEFREPEVESRLRKTREGTTSSRMSMPEAPVDEDRLTPGREREIRPSRPVLVVLRRPVAHRLDQTANLDLRRGVTASNTRHPFASLCFRKRVHPERTVPKLGSFFNASVRSFDARRSVVSVPKRAFTTARRTTRGRDHDHA